MTIVAGFDVHRRQITFDALDTETGELTRGRIDATPAAGSDGLHASRVARCRSRGRLAPAGCSSPGRSSVLVRSRIWPSRWRRVRCAGASGARRPIARTRVGCARCSARGDCRNPGSHQNTCASGARGRGYARRSSTSARSGCSASRRRCFTDGISGAPAQLRSATGREFLRELELPADARERIAIALEMVDSLDGQLHPLESELRKLARRQTGCRALMAQFGMGELTALMTLCELGDVERLSASRKAVRMAGIDIGVHRSDRRSRVGKLNRQGSPHLRWALYEAALSATRPKSPDHGDYLALKARGLSHTRASLTIARKLARWSFHILRELGPAALEPIRPPERYLHHSSLRCAPTPRWHQIFRPAPRTLAAPTPARRPKKDRAAGIAPPGTTDQPSRHRPSGRGPR